MTKEEKLQLIRASVVEINKKGGSVMTLGDKAVTQDDVISTGSMGLDIALGIGGLPKGRIVEIYGPESSGKTTLAIHIIAEAQKLGGICAIIDAEHAFDRSYAEALGVNADELYIDQPDNGEQGLEIADKLASSGGFDVIVIDSVAALVPKAELEGAMGDSKMGLHARLMSQALRKLTATISKNNVLFIFINQLREKLGMMFGNPETTTGGNALKFYSSIRLDIRRSVADKNQVKNEDDEMIGNQTTIKVVKNKVAPPFKKAVFNILFGEGIDKTGEILDIGVELGILKKSGSWFSYNDNKLANSKSNTRQLLLDNPELRNEIENQIKQKLNDTSNS